MDLFTLIIVAVVILGIVGFIMDALGGVAKLIGAIVILYFALDFLGIIV